MEGTKPHLIFENLWQKKDSLHGEEVKKLWRKNFPAITDEQLSKRLLQVVFAIRTEHGQVVGVSTSHKAYIEQLKNRMYNFRCFIDPEHRIPGLTSTLLVKTRDWLEEIHLTDGESDRHCIGMITLVERSHLASFEDGIHW
jgi:broad specificity phosphatase PhoE